MQNDFINILMKANTSSQNLWFTWTLTLTLGWLLIQYAGISLRHVSFYTWEDVFPVLGQFAINGLLIGALSGVLCGIVFRLWTNNAWLWGVTTFLGYAVGSPLGFLLAIGLSWVLARLNGIELLAGSSYFLMMPLIFTMLFTGGLVALSQLLALQKTVPKLTWKDRTLWILGSAVSWGIGFIVANLAWGSGLPIFFQSTVIGLSVSVLTGGLLQVLLVGNRLFT